MMKNFFSLALPKSTKSFSFPIACLVFALVGIPLGITAHRRETSFGFAASLVIGVFYFLFIIIADTLRANAKLHPNSSSGSRTSCFWASAGGSSGD